MDDLISRKTVLALPRNKVRSLRTYEVIEETINVTDIEHLPSAQPEQQWIPVTERPPEKDGRYQVTRYDYVTNTEFIDILWYEKNIWWNGHLTGDYAVTAWMPLPEPYKERREDG